MFCATWQELVTGVIFAKSVGPCRSLLGPIFIIIIIRGPSTLIVIIVLLLQNKPCGSSCTSYLLNTIKTSQPKPHRKTNFMWLCESCEITCDKRDHSFQRVACLRSSELMWHQSALFMWENHMNVKNLHVENLITCLICEKWLNYMRKLGEKKAKIMTHNVKTWTMCKNQCENKNTCRKSAPCEKYEVSKNHV